MILQNVDINLHFYFCFRSINNLKGRHRGIDSKHRELREDTNECNLHSFEALPIALQLKGPNASYKSMGELLFGTLKVVLC